MTLVLTQISKLGITMAADTAVLITGRMPNGMCKQRVLTGVTKLQPISKLHSGISVWGEGRIGGQDSDIWLDQFIRRRESEYDSLDTFATLLQEELRTIIPDIDAERNPHGNIGFHLAGFTESGRRRVPTFYHIHNGKSQVLEARGVTIDPRKINANHDLPPQEVVRFLDQGRTCLIRNGDYALYLQIFEHLRQLLEDLATRTR